MDVRNKLFHGINLGNYGENIDTLTDIDVLKSILDSKSIFTRDDLYEKNKKIYNSLNLVHSQSMCEVCLAIHPENENFVVCQKDLFDEINDAFGVFIRNNISLILDEKLLNNREFEMFGMSREIRVKSSICIEKYLMAIGYYDYFYQSIMELEKIIERKNLTYNDIKNKCGVREILYLENLEEDIIKRKQKYFIIKEMLKKFGLSVPIIDAYTGIPINEDLSYTISKAKELREKIKIIKK